jgi:hypothetical protein
MTMRRSIIAIALYLALPVAAFAQGGSGTPQEQAACRADVRRYCHTASGDAAITDCLKTHRDKLSKACLGVFASHGQ